MDSILTLPIIIPAIAGITILLVHIKGVREFVVIVSTFLTLLVSIFIFLNDIPPFSFKWIPQFGINFDLVSYHFANFVLVASSLFGFLIALYSIKYMEKHSRLSEYYAYFLWTISATSGILLSDNLLLLFIFWELSAVFLYGLTTIGGLKAFRASTKTFVILNTWDFLMLLGIVLVWFLSGMKQEALSISYLTKNKLNLAQGEVCAIAFILLGINAFTKAGSMPFHTWIPAVATSAPVTVTALVPAALDKLLGIYLLYRVCFDIFVWDIRIGIMLMSIGAVTIIAASMMALIQKDLNKLLAYSGISQVGYMILGVGTGTPVGVLGGIFHMINHAIYKSCLFLCSGSVEYRTKITDLSKLGGLASFMPITFIACLVAALSNSGVPPFNGFVSKWMIYQGIIELQNLPSVKMLFPLFLIAAMFGSALTLAYFIKVLHSVFLGRLPEELENKKDDLKEAPSSITVSLVVLAGLCVIFGVGAQIPLNYLIIPIVKDANLSVSFSSISALGIWSPTITTFLLVLSLFIGVLIYVFGRINAGVEKEVFLGGEEISLEDVRIPGTFFYQPVKGEKNLSKMYEEAYKETFDLYTQGINFAGGFANYVFQYIERPIDKFFDNLYRLPVLLGETAKNMALWNIVALIILLLISFSQKSLALYKMWGIVAMLLGAVMALVETNFHRFLIFACISHTGYLFLGVGLGIPLGIVGSRMDLIHFIIVMALLLLSGELMIAQTGEANIKKLQGVSKNLVYTSLGFIIGGLSFLGIPPLGGFFTKFLLTKASLEVNLIYTLVYVIATVLTLAYMLRAIRYILLSPPIKEYKEEMSPALLMVILLAIICVFLGVYVVLNI